MTQASARFVAQRVRKMAEFDQTPLSYARYRNARDAAIGRGLVGFSHFFVVWYDLFDILLCMPLTLCAGCSLRHGSVYVLMPAQRTIKRRYKMGDMDLMRREDGYGNQARYAL